MKMKMGLRIWVAGTLAAFAAVCGQATDLKAMKGIYEKNTEEITQGCTFDFDALQLQYGKMLETLKGEFQSQGELKKTKAALAEIDRFRKQKSLPPDDSEVPEIKALQVSYVKRFSQLEQEMVRRLGARTVQYEQDLVGLLKALTKAGKLDEATAVEAEQAEVQREIKKSADQLKALKAGTVNNATRLADVAATAAEEKPGAKNGPYLVIDLSGGPEAKKYPVTYLADVPKDGWTDEYKTGKLVMRRIEPGTFVMGSPKEELGRNVDENQHEITLTQAFYIGVFEVTQRQWERVMGDWPSFFNNAKCRDDRPVEKVSYNDIRGSNTGAEWPASSKADATSFMGKLRARAGLMAFDLPTESQWEYACRAGTTTALNSGKNLTSTNSCPNLAELGRYADNSGDGAQNGDTKVGTAEVGSYLPNSWGLYDMYGNVWDWCLDWSVTYPSMDSDPKGAGSGSRRVGRSGAWNRDAKHCRSAKRGYGNPLYKYDYSGFRVAMTSD